jgi:hypothetical protein
LLRGIPKELQQIQHNQRKDYYDKLLSKLAAAPPIINNIEDDEGDLSMVTSILQTTTTPNRTNTGFILKLQYELPWFWCLPKI